MRAELTIGALAQRTGVSPKTIRFYEQQGVLPAAARTPAGYRAYTPRVVRRLRLVRQARAHGLPLAETKPLVEQAFASECHPFGDQLLAHIVQQRAAIDQRMAELAALRDELDVL